MTMTVEKRKLEVNGKTVNIGVDVHKRSWRVTALVEGGAPDGAYDLAVTADADMVGKTVAVLDGDRTLSEVMLMADEYSGYAIGSIPLPMPGPASPLVPPRVMLDGREIGRLQVSSTDKRAPIALFRHGADAVLTGMEAMDWGGSFFGRQLSFPAVLTEIVRAGGQPVTYAEVMGLSGHAFRLTVGDQWCPSAALSDGYYCHARAMKVFGYEATSIELDKGNNADGVASLAQAVVASINASLPVIYMDGEHSLIVGYRDNGASYICQPYAGQRDCYLEMECPRGMLGEAWSATVLQRTEPMDRREAIIMSLRAAIVMAETPAFGEGRSDGFAAYESWIGGLRNPPEEVNLHANAYCYAILLTSRQAAADYLWTIADELDGDVAEHLRRAADRYANVAARMYDGRGCVEYPWDENWTPENRAIEADIMTANLADERVAISEIKQALTAMGESFQPATLPSAGE